MNWTLMAFNIWKIYFIGSILCWIQQVKTHGQNETNSSKSFKRSFDFPPIFYPGPDNKFITVAPPPQLPDNIKVFVNNLGSPEITTFRSPFTSKNEGSTSPVQKPHKPPKSHTKPFRTSTSPFPSKTSHEDSNSIQTHNFPSTPMPTPRAAGPQHIRPPRPSSSTAKPTRRKNFRDHRVQPTTFRPNNEQHSSTLTHPFFREFRQNIQNKRPDHFTELPRGRQPQRPKTHRFRGESHQQRPAPLGRPDFNAFDSKQPRNGSPPKQFQPMPPQKSFVIPVYMSGNKQGQFSSTSRPFSSAQAGQFLHHSKQSKPSAINQFIPPQRQQHPPPPPPQLQHPPQQQQHPPLPPQRQQYPPSPPQQQHPPPPPRMKTPLQSKFAKGYHDKDSRPDIPRPYLHFSENVNGENDFKHNHQSSISVKDMENGFPRYKEQDHGLANKKTPVKSSGPLFYPHDDEERSPITPFNQQHRPKFSNTRLNNINDGRGLQNFSPVNHHAVNQGFSCKFLEPGYYADINNGCETFHVCHQRRQYSFTCPKGTLFSQQYLICDWSYRVTCSVFSVEKTPKV